MKLGVGGRVELGFRGRGRVKLGSRGRDRVELGFSSNGRGIA